MLLKFRNLICTHADVNVTEKMKKCGNANETVPQQAANRAGQ